MLFAIYSWMQFFFSADSGKAVGYIWPAADLFISLLGSAVGYFVIGMAEHASTGVSRAHHQRSDRRKYLDRTGLHCGCDEQGKSSEGNGAVRSRIWTGFILGPAIAGILSKYGIHVPFYFAAALSFVNAMALYFILPESVKPGAAVAKKRKNRIVRLVESFRDNEFRVINLVYFLLITAFSIMTYAFVLYTAFRFGYTAEQNGYLFAFVGLIAIVGQGVLFGVLAKQIRRSVSGRRGLFDDGR